MGMRQRAIRNENDKLSRFTIISIGNEYLDKLKYDYLIEKFASKNARRSIIIEVTFYFLFYFINI